jgi:hypothetical protein
MKARHHGPERGILVVVGENCLSRETVKSIARGRSPKKELAAARRHLADCPRCRAAVVAAAHGVEGPGDTVLLKRSGGAVSKTLKVVAVSASILATGAAFRYGASPKAEPPRDGRAQALEPPANAAGSTEDPTRASVSSASTWQRSVTVQQLAAPAPSAEPEPVQPTAAVEGLEAQPTVRVLGAAAEPPPARTDAYWHALSEPVAPATKRQRSTSSATRPASHSGASHSGARPASPPAATAKGEKKSDEYDFGIDEPPPSKGRNGVIRTTLD